MARALRLFNRVHGRSAHLFRARFGARLLEGELDLLSLCRYLAYNPVRAGLCGEPWEWPWGSSRASAGIDPRPPFLNERLLREAFGSESWRARYRDFIEQPTLLDMLDRGENVTLPPHQTLDTNRV